MRSYRLIILTLLVACKAATPSISPGTYSEDLSIHRPIKVIDPEQNEEADNNSSKVLEEEYKPLTGHIKSELDSIAKIAYQQNKAGRYVDGFVIQVYSGNSREEANSARSKMAVFFPELNPKISYHQPSFRVKAGQFTERLEANRVYNDVKEEFPRALLIPERFLLTYE